MIGQGETLREVGRVCELPPSFTDQPEVINGASNLIAGVILDAGKHARFAVSAPSLPRGVAVEIDAIF